MTVAMYCRFSRFIKCHHAEGPTKCVQIYNKGPSTIESDIELCTIFRFE